MSKLFRSFANRRIATLQAAVGFASLVSAIAPPAWATDAADAIINRGIKALGGEATLAKTRATTSKVKSTFISGDNARVSKIEHTTDGRDRMRMTVEDDFDGPKFMAITVIDGDKGWRKEGEKEVVELEGQELVDEKWGIFWQSVPFTLLELKDSKLKTEAVGDVRVGGKPAAGVKVTGAEGKDFTIYFDTTTGLPVKAVADVPDPESPGQEFTQEIYYSDYMDFSGIKRAKKIEIKRDGLTFIKMELLDFKVLDKVDDKTFAKPESAGDSDSFRVALQKLVVQNLTSQIEQDPTNAFNFLGRGLFHRKLGETDKALEDYEEAIRLGLKGNAAALSVAHHGRGWAWAAKGKYGKAFADYTEAIRLWPKNSDPYIGRASAWAAREEWDKALADYDEAIRLNPSSSEAHRGRGKAWEAKGQHDKATTDYDEALRLDRKNSETRRARGDESYDNGEYDKALADYDEAIRLDPTNAKAFIGRGNAWGAKGEYDSGIACGAEDEFDKALADYDEAIRLDPKNAEAFVGRGHALGATGEYDKALADYDEAIRLNPSSSEAHRGRGNAWHDKGEHDKAITDYDEAIRLDPKNSEAYIARGNAWGGKGEFDKALADFDGAIRLDPRNAEAFVSRGNAWGAKGELEKALAAFDAAIGFDPEDSAAYIGRGDAWHDKGEYDKALADYDEAIRLDPENSEAYRGRGSAWFENGEYDKALADYDEAIRLDPKNWQAYFGRGSSRGANGEHDKAIDDFKKAGELTDWKDFAFLDTLAFAYAEAGMFDKAAEWQEKAITLAPDAEKENCRARLKLYREGKPYRNQPQN